jgi:hypothetical protein
MLEKLVGLAGLVCSVSFAQDLVEHNLPDDGYAEVPLNFAFPYFGEIYTTSWMGSNGVIMLMSPTNTNDGARWSYCCNGQDLSKVTSPSFVIMPLWTDLIGYNENARFYSQSGDTWSRYIWKDVSEYYYGNWQNFNTFETTLNSAGDITFLYENVNITGHNVTVGFTGDMSEDGKYEQYYFDYGSTLSDLPLDESYSITYYGGYKSEEEKIVEETIDKIIKDSYGLTEEEWTETETYQEEYFDSEWNEPYAEEVFLEELYSEPEEEIVLYDEPIEEYYEETYYEEEKEEILIEEPTLNNNTLSIVMDVLRMDEEQLQAQVNNSSVDLSTESLMNESLAMGSLDSFLSVDIQDYSSFNVQQDNAPQTQRASQQINTMSTNDVNTMLESFAENMQESGGFGDQTVALLLMNGTSNINDYYNQQLPLQPQFYIDREIYRINLPDARNSVLRMNYNSSQIYDEMMDLQYGRN